ncbi:hypothetical protein Tco_1354127 [Tanacetum coccineum]
MESESERVIPELAAGSSKRDAEEELVQESLKRQKTGESSEPVEEPNDKEEEELFTLKELGSTRRSSELVIILRKSAAKYKGKGKMDLTQMLVAKFLVDQDDEMSRELLRKIFMHAERLRR